MNIQNKLIDKLKPAKYNPRQITTKQYKDLKDSITKFHDPNTNVRYEIKNEVGNIYFGPGWDRKHKVCVNENYSGNRITLGYDIHTQPDLPDDQYSLIPLL